MVNLTRRTKRVARYFDVDPLAVRIYAGLLVLLPLLSVALAGLLGSVAAGFVIAGVISVTVIAAIPHERSDRIGMIRERGCGRSPFAASMFRRK